MIEERLAEPTHALLDRMRERRVFEIGAGEGHWLRAMLDYGIDAIGVDPHPRPEPVRRADHRALLDYPDRDLVLIVWPPDGTDLVGWLQGWRGSVLVVGSFARFTTPTDWREKWQLRLPRGRKGGSDAVWFVVA